VLLIATASLDPWRGAATMAAFGIGTAPALLASSFGVTRLRSFMGQRTRRFAAGVLLAGAVLTLVGPWLVVRAPWLHGWLPYDCAIAAH
jgi:hypothetical protein